QDVRWHLLGRLWMRPGIGELVMGATTRGLLARTLRSGAADPNAWPDARIASIWQQFDQGTQRAILRLYRSADERELTRTGAAPALVAAAFAVAYVLVSPPSLDLAAHLLRAKLFSSEGFGIWNNWWYGGHHVPSYSVLFPPIAAALTPQVAAGLAACGSAALFE